MDNSKYFHRNVVFSKQGKQISIINIFNPDNERQVLESWFGLVLQLADGQHTIEELIQYVSSKYKGNPPPTLKGTIHSVIDRLSDAKLIVVTDEKTELPYYLSLPYEQLDVEKAKKLIEKDATANLNDLL